jgi:hypothetical protein
LLVILTTVYPGYQEEEQSKGKANNAADRNKKQVWTFGYMQVPEMNVPEMDGVHDGLLCFVSGKTATRSIYSAKARSQAALPSPGFNHRFLGFLFSIHSASTLVGDANRSEPWLWRATQQNDPEEKKPEGFIFLWCRRVALQEVTIVIIYTSEDKLPGAKMAFRHADPTHCSHKR